MVGMGRDQSVSEAALDQRPFRQSLGRDEAEDGQRPADRIGERVRVQGSQAGPTGQLGEEHFIDVCRPHETATDRREDLASRFRAEGAGGVHRPEHVLGRCALPDGEDGPYTSPLRAEEPMGAPGEADPVSLKPVSQPRLRDAPTGLDLVGQGHEVADQFGVHLRGESSRHRSQEDSRQTRGRVAGEAALTERQPSGRRDGPGMKDLELGQEHGRQRYSDDPAEGVPEPAGEVDDVFVGAVVGLKQIDQLLGRSPQVRPR